MNAELNRENLVATMSKMASGDVTALSHFVDEFGPHLARSVGGVLKSMGRSDVARRDIDMHFLVWSSALVIFDRAHRWNEAGSRPWVWAHRAIRAEVVAWLGHPSVVFDPHVHVAAECDTSVAAGQLNLHTLADDHVEVARWISAVEEVANERDRLVHVEYQTQKHLGDRSPATTVSSMFGLSPANVRQIDRRVRKRLASHPFHASEIAPMVIG